ncbi:MAG: O-antigen ligase family protein [Candidatus Moraniibacteriota bacterium]|nr:MAG: O-antigen ligase family protein [Candidatus Moranbacteria bacterium]
MKSFFNDKFLLLFLLFLPFQFALNISETFDVGITRLIIFLAFFFWIHTVLISGKLELPKSKAFWLGISFLFFAALSFLWAQNQEWALRKVFFLINFFLLFFMASWMFFQKKWTPEALSKALAFSGCLSSLVAIFQFTLPFFFGIEKTLLWWRTLVAPLFLGESFSESVIEYSSWLVNVGGETVFRAIGFFPDPHIAAFYWEFCLVWTLIYAYSKKSWGYAMIASIILLALLLTFSRGAYIALFFFAFLGISFFLVQMRKFRLIVGLFISLFLCFSFIFYENPFFERALSSFSTLDNSNAGRLDMWKQSWYIIMEKPWGVGMGGYALEILPSAEYRDPIYAHNIYLDIAVEMGLFSLFLWVMWIGASFLIGLQQRKKNLYALSMMFSLGVFSLHTFFDTPLFSIHIISVLFLVLSSVFWFEKEQKEEIL